MSTPKQKKIHVQPETEEQLRILSRLIEQERGYKVTMAECLRYAVAKAIKELEIEAREREETLQKEMDI